MNVLPRTLLAAVLLGALSPAYAVPDMWRSGFGMGVFEHIITSSQHTELNISCTSNPDENEVLQHSVLVTLPNGKILSSRDENTHIILVTGDEQYSVPSSLGWRNGDNEWIAFIDAIGKATSFEIWLNDKKVGSFSPSAGNINKVLSDMAECTTLTAE
ncbi:hypothetical protein [Klebsiella oxytoca]|jgi:hypothetical protein|uniref:hypothetical protein n=1 Tax=Klebsiella oxytoca TaxID=571 RepID=UPI00044A0E21|nr:hypothetical protein [Klebsiella oxytoca]EHT9908217.1 hypothetical protein [Klebsiella oxytoca]EUC84365.1 hypothetical protein HMPREF1570_2123 [Klebsiella oxytoca KA-2]HEC2030462.1 hypothetical protein [Klebsiella oxytoca]